MRSITYAVVSGVAGAMLTFGSASAAPTVGANPAENTSAVQKAQSFGIYIGPRYGYRDRYWDGYPYGRSYGYGYGYYPNYYYGPRRYYYDGYGYSGSDRRVFRRLQRKAP